MRFSRRQRVDPSINLTSLIDILFIVLLFLVLTTAFRGASVVEVDLPPGGDRRTDHGRPTGHRQSDGVPRRSSVRLAAAGDIGRAS